MRRFTLIALFMLFFVDFKSNIIKDTVKTPIGITFDNKKQILRTIINSFIKKKFDTLVIFFNFDIEFYTRYSGNNSSIKKLTDYGAISELNNIFTPLNYEKITALIFTNEYKTEIIKISIFCCSETDKPDLEVFFFLNRNQEINSIMIQ